MPNVTVSTTIDNFMQAADAPAAKMSIEDVSAVITTSATSISTKTLSLCNSTNDSGWNIILPTAASVSGKRYTIKKVDASINPVRVLTTSSQTIDGYTFYDIINQYDFIEVESDGSNWHIVNKN